MDTRKPIGFRFDDMKRRPPKRGEWYLYSGFDFPVMSGFDDHDEDHIILTPIYADKPDTIPTMAEWLEDNSGVLNKYFTDFLDAREAEKKYDPDPPPESLADVVVAILHARKVFGVDLQTTNNDGVNLWAVRLKAALEREKAKSK